MDAHKTIWATEEEAHAEGDLLRRERLDADAEDAAMMALVWSEAELAEQGKIFPENGDHVVGLRNANGELEAAIHRASGGTPCNWQSAIRLLITAKRADYESLNHLLSRIHDIPLEIRAMFVRTDEGLFWASRVKMDVLSETQLPVLGVSALHYSMAADSAEVIDLRPGTWDGQLELIQSAADVKLRLSRPSDDARTLCVIWWTGGEPQTTGTSRFVLARGKKDVWDAVIPSIVDAPLVCAVCDAE